MYNVEMNKNVKLSQHFTLGELCKTSVKTADGNIPSHVHIENLKRLCGWLERLRQRAVGGAATSNHLTGCAADIRCKGIEQAIRYAFILLDISAESGEAFDELLIEQSDKSIWVHFAVRPEGNRRKVAFLKK